MGQHVYPLKAGGLERFGLVCLLPAGIMCVLIGCNMYLYVACCRCNNHDTPIIWWCFFAVTIFVPSMWSYRTLTIKDFHSDLIQRILKFEGLIYSYFSSNMQYFHKNQGGESPVIMSTFFFQTPLIKLQEVNLHILMVKVFQQVFLCFYLINL
jgi:hypothetical protein